MIDLGDLKDLISVEVGNDGKLYLTIESDLVLRINGHEHKHVEGTSLQTSGIDTVQCSGRFHHTNPAGAEFYDNHLKGVSADPHLRDVLEAKGKLYEEEHERTVRRIRYAEAHQRNISRRPRRKRGFPGRCGCSCK